MFTHAEATGQKEHDCRVFQDHQQPLPRKDVWAKVPAMELLTHETTWEEIAGLYHKVYQLKRNPRAVPCSEDTTEEISIEILETLKENIQCRLGSAQLGGVEVKNL